MMLAEVTILSFAAASISFTVTEMKIFASLREASKQRSDLLGNLLSCSYCFGHWVSFALVAIYRPSLFEFWLPLDLFLTALVIAWFAAAQCMVMCKLMDWAGK